MMFAETGRQIRALAQRSDVVKAVASQNDVTIRELFAPAAKISELDVLLAVAADGHFVGASSALDLLNLTEALALTDLSAAIGEVLARRRRRRPDRRARPCRDGSDAREFLDPRPRRRRRHLGP